MTPALLAAALAQAMSGSPPERIDLLIPQPCEAERPAEGEVIVCAPAREGSSPYRIKQPPPEPSEVPKAEVQLGKGTSVSAETEQVDVGGFPSNRAMVRLKVKF